MSQFDAVLHLGGIWQSRGCSVNRKAIVLANLRRDHADIIVAIEKCHQQTG